MAGVAFHSHSTDDILCIKLSTRLIKKTRPWLHFTNDLTFWARPAWTARTVSWAGNGRWFDQGKCRHLCGSSRNWVAGCSHVGRGRDRHWRTHQRPFTPYHSLPSTTVLWLWREMPLFHSSCLPLVWKVSVKTLSLMAVGVFHTSFINAPPLLTSWPTKVFWPSPKPFDSAQLFQLFSRNFGKTSFYKSIICECTCKHSMIKRKCLLLHLFLFSE